MSVTRFGIKESPTFTKCHHYIFSNCWRPSLIAKIDVVKNINRISIFYPRTIIICWKSGSEIFQKLPRIGFTGWSWRPAARFTSYREILQASEEVNFRKLALSHAESKQFSFNNRWTKINIDITDALFTLNLSIKSHTGFSIKRWRKRCQFP